MQTIKIVIADGKAKSVEINEVRKEKTTKEIEEMLHSMPKTKLAEALSAVTDNERQGYADELSDE